MLDLIENILFKVGIENETIAYGLSALLKLHDKFVAEQGRIATMIGSFKSHSDM